MSDTKYAGAVVEGLAILMGMDLKGAKKIRDQHNAGHDMTDWINHGLEQKKDGSLHEDSRNLSERGDGSNQVQQEQNLLDDDQDSSCGSDQKIE